MARATRCYYMFYDTATSIQLYTLTYSFKQEILKVHYYGTIITVNDT